MAVSLNSVVGFSSTKLGAKYQIASKPCISVKTLPTARRKRNLTVSVSGGTENSQRSVSEDRISQNEVSSSPPPPHNGSPPPPPPTTTTTKQEEKPKKSPLTARERLRAARVLSRYNADSAPTPPKGDLGSKVLDALRESDRGKKKGLPEAPGNMLDDGKRGLPPNGLTFDLPVGSDLLVIIFSFVFITTVMFGTTFIVWKLGAIHFNEY